MNNVIPLSFYKMIKFYYFMLFFILLFSCDENNADAKLETYEKYKVIKTIYIMGSYNDLNDRTLSRDKAKASLHKNRLADRAYVAFFDEVIPGTILTIEKPLSKIWHIPIFVPRYLVSLEPDVSQGLDVILSLDRGLEGSLDGLNPDFFTRFEENIQTIK